VSACIGSVPATAALHWWHAVQLASLHPWLLGNSSASFRPYPILHRHQQQLHVTMDTDDVTLEGSPSSEEHAVPTAVPEAAAGKCDSSQKPTSSSSSAQQW